MFGWEVRWGMGGAGLVGLVVRLDLDLRME